MTIYNLSERGEGREREEREWEKKKRGDLHPLVCSPNTHSACGFGQAGDRRWESRSPSRVAGTRLAIASVCHGLQRQDTGVRRQSEKSTSLTLMWDTGVLTSRLKAGSKNE